MKGIQICMRCNGNKADETKILCGQLNNCSAKLADISTSHPQGKREARCEINGGFIGMAPVLACLWLGAELESSTRLALAWPAPPPTFFIVVIQQPGNS